MASKEIEKGRMKVSSFFYSDSKRVAKKTEGQIREILKRLIDLQDVEQKRSSFPVSQWLTEESVLLQPGINRGPRLPPPPRPLIAKSFTQLRPWTKSKTGLTVKVDMFFSLI